MSAPIAERLRALAEAKAKRRRIMRVEDDGTEAELLAIVEECERIAGEMREGADGSENVDWDLHEWADALAGRAK